MLSPWLAANEADEARAFTRCMMKKNVYIYVFMYVYICIYIYVCIATGHKYSSQDESLFYAHVTPGQSGT